MRKRQQVAAFATFTFQTLYFSLQVQTSRPVFYGDLVYKFRKRISKYDFPYHFKKIIVRYKKVGYNIDVFRQHASNYGPCFSF